MHFRRERKSGTTVSLQETLEAGKDDTALTLSDVLQDGFCMEDSCEQQDEARRLRQLIEGLPARERKLILLRYGRSTAADPAGNRKAAADQPELCFPPGDPRAGTAAGRVGRMPVKILTFIAECFHTEAKNAAWNASSSSNRYRRFSASTSSFFERRGGRPKALSSAYFRSALPGVPESPQS